MDAREPQEPVSEPMDERLFFAELRDQHASYVPVIGSGLSVGAGAPGFGALLEHLVTQAASEGVKVPATSDTDPFEAVEAVAVATGEEWVQQKTAEFYADRELRPHPRAPGASEGRCRSHHHDQLRPGYRVRGRASREVRSDDDCGSV